MIEKFKSIQLDVQKEEIDSHHLVLIEGTSKRSDTQMTGITDTMKRVVFEQREDQSYNKGDLWLVKVNEATQNTLFADPMGKMSIDEYYRLFNGDRKV